MRPEKITNSGKLEQILLNFIDVLRINILVVDSKGTPVLAPQTSGYGFNGSSRWGILQYLGTPEFIKKFQKEEYYLKHVDQFGLHSFALPIFIGEPNEIGYLFLGPVILNKPLDQARYQAVAQEMNVDFSEFVECLGELRIVTFNSLKTILDLLSELSRYALRTKNTEKSPSNVIFETLLDLSMALTQAECGSIMLLNKSTNELSVQIFKGNNLQKLQNKPVKMGEGIAGLAAQKKETFIIDDGEANNRIRHLMKKPELKCAVVMPIVKNEEVLGVMNISTRQGASRLSTHSQQILKSLNEITSGTISSLL